MADTARGVRTKASLTREAIVNSPTWPAATAAAAAALLPLLSESVRERPAREAVLTTEGRLAPDLLGRNVGGDVQLLGVYQGLETLWACALGVQAKRYAATVFPQNLTGAYLHRFECDVELKDTAWSASLEGFSGGELSAGQQKVRRMTWCSDRQVACWEALSSLIGSVEIEATPAGVSLSLGLLSHSITRDSAVNPTLSALSDPGFVPLRFHELTLRLGEYSLSTALESGDDLAVSGVRLALDNRLTAQPSVTTWPAIDAPARLAPAAVQGQLFVPRYSDAGETLLAWSDAGTQLMASLVFSGPVIPSTAIARELRLWLPCVTLLEADVPTTGPAWQQLAMPFAAYPEATPAGFPATVRETPLVVEVVSTLSTNPLL